MISGHVVIRSAVTHDFPIRECVRSMFPLCEEIVILCDPEPDGTVEWCEEVQRESEGRVRLLIEPWWDVNGGRELLSRATNRCIEACSGEFHLYLQADEALHEQEAARIRRIAEGRSRDWAYLPWLHFWGDGQRVCPNPVRICQRSIRLGRRSLYPRLRAYADAMTLGTPDSNPLLLRGCTALRTAIYHYGYICRPRSRETHEREMAQLLEQAYDVRANEETTWREIIPDDELVPFTGTHPAVMREWLEARGLS